MKKSELKQLIKEVITELNVKKEKQPVLGQLGVKGSDGSVETIRIITGDPRETENFLRSNYSNRIKLQTILDFGDIHKLGPNTESSEFLERDKDIAGQGSRLKDNVRGFVAVAKSNKAQFIYLYDLASKTWTILPASQFDTLLIRKKKVE